MKARTKELAWEIVNAMVPELEINWLRTERGNGRTWTNSEGVYVIDLNTRYEINTPDGKSVNVWYSTKEYTLEPITREDAARIIAVIKKGLDTEVGDRLVDGARSLMKTLESWLRQDDPQWKFLRQRYNNRLINSLRKEQ
jgi:hypothetical protein